MKILDIGAGTGCIGISLGRYLKNAGVTLLDVSKEAIDISQKNADINHVTVSLLCKDILKDDITGKYDIVVSNPPYIETQVINTLDDNVRLFEPLTALDGGGDGLMFYRRIAALDILKKDGMMFFEIGHDQCDVVKEIMQDGFYGIGSRKDLCGIQRIIFGRKK